MISAGRHYDDEALIALLESGDEHVIARDPHISTCPVCSEVAHSVRLISGALGEEDVWDRRELNEKPSPNTIAALRTFADEMAREDAQAALWLDDLLHGSREEWMAKLQGHPEYRTAGVVRKLIAATDRALDTMPPDAVAITALATDIADNLQPTAYATDTVAKLRGAAWRERAYALFYVGSYAKAETAIRASESHFSDCVVNEYDLGRDDIVHALIHRALDRDAEAIAVGDRAALRLGHYEDTQRCVSTVMVQAQARIKVFDYAGALELLTKARIAFSDSVSPDTHARLLSNIGLCRRALRDFAGAIEDYRAAALIFDELDVSTEAARLRGNIAYTLREAGKIKEASSEMSETRASLEQFGMAADVAISDLILAEIALTAGDYGQVEILCRQAMRYFESAGVSYGPRALTALAYLTEATRQRRVTPEVVSHVKDYIKRLPSQPTLLYAPPPA